MKMPWTKSIDRLELKIQKTFSDFRRYVDGAIEKSYEKSQKNYYTMTRSEQFKHNDHKRRLIVLETILKEKVDLHHQGNIDRELAAAADAEK